MADYEFVTKWQIGAPLDKVWSVIEDANAWPEWWKGVISVNELERGDQNGVGSIKRTIWKSALPYNLEFDTEVIRVEHQNLIEVRAFGALDGVGIWQFASAGADITNVRYYWTVKTTKPWMNILAPVARPFFRWNHDTVMSWGEDGLRRRLGIS